jgi:hypothetical protein
VLEIRLVFSPSQPVHSGSGILLEFEERLLEQLDGDMVEERGGTTLGGIALRTKQKSAGCVRDFHFPERLN